MIESEDRSGYFGASDTAIIMGNWSTKTFSRWWMQKLGLDNSHISTKAMNAGTYYEHAILEHIGVPRMDHQIIIPDLRLRVNYDGDAPGSIWEVKTHSADKVFRVSKAYWQQVQVQTFAKLTVEHKLPRAEIVAYGLTEADYRNFFNDIDPQRLSEYTVEYDPGFIRQYLKRLKYLRDRLNDGRWPDETSN